MLLFRLGACACAILVVGCASGSGPDAGDRAASTAATSQETAAADAFPVTIEHAFGETVIASEPQRVATVSWANHEVPLALGIVPVGMAEVTWGDDDGDGVMPWVEERLSALGAEVPVLYDETDGIDFEAVADTNPDVILAAYSGLTEEDYTTLSQIAPVVAYPQLPWATSVQDMILMSSRAMGMSAEGERLVADYEADVAAAFAEHPELEGKRVMFSYLDPNDLSTVGFYTTHDTRAAFLAEVGMQVPSVVEERSAASETFYETISAEAGDQLDDVDILVTYGAADGSTLQRYQSDPLLSQIPAIARGSVVVLEESTPLAAAANPSPLSIAWALEDYVDLLAAAAATVE
ncbi:iron-siderophore ABC transporter substrate-binding protein [Egicoccus sp. AB-alg6-2]|uniref:iron-siderophore ABC transporter substrate-binding protein n=1 Tax=Egicoccus sp. AB-alg6-2 TaxID=3242692 RepID=UPI00359D46C0